MASTSGAGATTSADQTSKSSSTGRLFTTVEDDRADGEATNGLQEYVDTLSDDTRGSLLTLQETDQSTTSATGSDTLFAAIDQDADGSISEDEFSNFVQSGEPPPPPPPPADATGDTSDASDASDVFAAIDSDGDGSISQSELSSFLDQTQTADATTSEDGSTTSGTSGATGSASQTFDAMDTNEDGTVSEAELAAYLGASSTDGPPPPPSAPPDAASTSTSTVTAATATDTDQSTGSSTMSSRQMAAALASYAGRASGGDLASQIA